MPSIDPERVFVDTNIFLRYLTNDDPEQADEVERLLVAAAAGSVSLLTNVIVLAEIVWTLESTYKLQRDEIRDHVLAILNNDGLVVENEDLILQAITDYVDLNIDFADAYSASWSIIREVTTICTFDSRHFGRIDDIDVRSPGEIMIPEGPPQS